MYSIKQERNSKNHKKISNNIMIKHFSVNLVVVTLVTTLMLMPLHIFASERAWVAQWNGNHHLTVAYNTSIVCLRLRNGYNLSTWHLSSSNRTQASAYLPTPPIHWITFYLDTLVESTTRERRTSDIHRHHTQASHALVATNFIIQLALP